MKRISLAKYDNKIYHYSNRDRNLVMYVSDNVEQLPITYWKIC